MRIAMVSEHASPLAVIGGVDAGGQNVHVAGLSTALARAGHAVVVYTRRDDPTLATRVPFAEGVVVHHVDAGPAVPIPKDHLLPFMDEFARVLRRAWCEDPPDIVHSHFWMSGAALRAADGSTIPVAHTFHALGVVKRRHQGTKDTSPSSRLVEEQAIVRGADCIVATCSGEAFELLRMGADLHRLAIVPCGVDLKVFTPDGPSEERSRARRRVVVITRLVERKGVGNVITALANLPDAELVIAGGPARDRLAEDEEYQRLSALARTTHVTDRVDFRGRLDRNQVARLLRSADVVACVPWYEPFGIVPLEAMACGIPVVASSVGGLVDSVVDRLTGLHVPPRRPDAIAMALGELLSDPALCAAFGAAGHERVRARYDWERVASSTVAVYRKLLARRGVDAYETAVRR
jgi:D-inositol-3-phosphate glycosyltransferase